MEIFFTLILVLLFVLATFDLYVGVSNDAVNFLNSAIGSKAAKFRTISIVAAIGVFAGCIFSSGMMDIARHGIFHPSLFTFQDVMFIYVAVMVTDIILLDVFNSLGMPTSTTVSLVFELLGAAFAFTLIKMASGTGIEFGAYLNSDKAIQVIIGIFMSVPIAFIFGAISQAIARLIFTFNYKHKSPLISSLYVGGAFTVILYFMLFKGMKTLTFMTEDVIAFINAYSIFIFIGGFFTFSIIALILKLLKVNILKLVVLAGTFSLAMAFAGNDLVNFIGVPLAGFSSYMDFFSTSASSPTSYYMTSLESSAGSSFLFLLGAGSIMVVALMTSKKARRVSQTEVSLSSSQQGDELFGSSGAARSIVKGARIAGQFISKYIPSFIKTWVNKRFAPPTRETQQENEGRAYDLVRASVNLCMTSLLIALGTSLKLPLSTTFVTFMVAMGTSLADRAWTRESAVFRITGVLSVIGGWFITAGAAFISCFIIALAASFGGKPVIIILVITAILIVVSSQRKFSRKNKMQNKGDQLFKSMLQCQDVSVIPGMLGKHMRINAAEQIELSLKILAQVSVGLFNENNTPLKRNKELLDKNKQTLKNLRRRETICLRRSDNVVSLRVSTYFWRFHNALRQIQYGLERMNEPVLDHVNNLFSEVNSTDAESIKHIEIRVKHEFEKLIYQLKLGNDLEIEDIKSNLKLIRGELRKLRYDISVKLQNNNKDVDITTSTMLIHIIHEMEHIVMDTREVAKSIYKYFLTLNFNRNKND